jgi:hypothetical protein
VELFRAAHLISLEIGQFDDRSPAHLDERESAHRLEDTLRSLFRDSFRIMIFGDFSSGKSTLINALVGQDLLPTKENPTTAFTTILRYGEQEQAELFRDPYEESEPAETVDLETFSDRVTLRLGEDGELHGSPYALGVISLPVDELSKGVELIDTAGTNESPERERITLDYLSRVDAVIYATPARGGFSSQDEIYLEKLKLLGHKEIFFAVTQFDIIRREKDRAEVRQRCERIAGRHIGNLGRRLFFVSALTSLEHRLDDPEQPRDDPGLVALEQNLWDFCVNDRARIKVLRPAELLRAEVVKMRRRIDARREMLSLEEDELRSRLGSTTALQTTMRKTLHHIETVLDRWMDQTRTDVQAEFESFMTDTVAPQIAGWGDDIPVKLGHRLLKLNKDARYGDAIRAIETYLTTRVQEETLRYVHDQLPDVLDRGNVLLERDLLPLMLEYEQMLEDVRGLLTGSDQAVERDVLQRWLRDVGSQIPDRVLTKSNPMMVWPNAVGAAGAAGAGGLGVLGLIALGLGGWVAAPVVAALGLGTLITGRITRNRLRQQTVAEYHRLLMQNARESARQFADQHATAMDEFARAVRGGLRAKLDDLIRDAELTISELSGDQDAVKDRRRRLEQAERGLTDVDSKVNALVHSFVDPMR